MFFEKERWRDPHINQPAPPRALPHTLLAQIRHHELGPADHFERDGLAGLEGLGEIRILN